MHKHVKDSFIILFISFLIICAIEFSLGFMSLKTKNYEVMHNDHDLEKNSILLPSKEALPFSIKFNLLHNQLTAPHPKYLYKVRENLTKAEMLGYEGINKNGFRSELFNDLAKDSLRIAIFGDSCAFGWGLKKLNQTWPFLLKKKIENYQNKPVQIYNFSQPGHSSEQTKIIFNEYINELRPHVVIIYSGWNDVWKSNTVTDRELLSSNVLPNNILTRFIVETNTFRYAQHLKSKYDNKINRKHRVLFSETIENYQYFMKKVEALNSKVLIIPAFHSTNKGDYFVEMEKRMAKIKEKLIAPNDNIVLNNQNNFFQEDGYHPNEKGAQHISQSLFNKIKIDL